MNIHLASMVLMSMAATATDALIEAAIPEPDPERRIEARTRRISARIARAAAKRARRAERRLAQR